MSKIFRPALLSLALAAVAACGDGPSVDRGRPAGTTGGDGPLRVVTTTGIIADVAARIAGPHAKVEALMGPGIDPHLFKASESDVRKLAGAELILYNGLHLEGKMGDILTKMARTRPVLAVTEEIPQTALREPPEFAGQYDPHVWFDVSMWALTLAPIERQLAELRPAQKAEFAANRQALEKELAALDAQVKADIASIPEGQRVLVTAHDAFGYFGRRYGMEVIGLQGISTLSEAGLGDVSRVADLVAKRKVKAIFIEASVPRRSIEAVQAAVRNGGHEVTIGGQLFSDSLGAAGTPAGTYPGMVRANVDTIVKALR